MNNNTNSNESNQNESNAARRLRALEGDKISENTSDEPLKIDKLGNFWYHNKWKVIVITAFAFVIGVGIIQFAGKSNPDISIIYAGPTYVTPDEGQKLCLSAEAVIDDYNGDGTKKVRLNDMVFMTENQMKQMEEYVKESGEEVAFDRLANSQMQERFTYEIFGSEASICILAEDQYREVLTEGGFLPLSEIFGSESIPEGAIDEYGVRICDTKFCKFYLNREMFTEDTVIALRRLTTMSAITGKKKAERLHAASMDAFKKILTFDYPEGYTEGEE